MTTVVATPPLPPARRVGSGLFGRARARKDEEAGAAAAAPVAAAVAAASATTPASPVRGQQQQHHQQHHHNHNHPGSPRRASRPSGCGGSPRRSSTGAPQQHGNNSGNGGGAGARSSAPRPSAATGAAAPANTNANTTTLPRQQQLSQHHSNKVSCTGGAAAAAAPSTGPRAAHLPPSPFLAAAAPVAAAAAPPQQHHHHPAPPPANKTLLRSMLSAAAASTPEWRPRSLHPLAGPLPVAAAPAPQGQTTTTTPSPLSPLSLLPLRAWLRAAAAIAAVLALALLAAASARDPVAGAAAVATALIGAAGALQAAEDHEEALRRQRRQRQQEQARQRRAAAAAAVAFLQQHHSQQQQQQLQQPPLASAATATARVSVVLSGDVVGVKATTATAAVPPPPPPQALRLPSPGAGPPAPCPSPVLGAAAGAGGRGCAPAYSNNLGTGPDALARAALLALPEGELPGWSVVEGGAGKSGAGTPHSSSISAEPSWLTDDIKRRFLVCKPSVRVAEESARATHAARTRMAVDGGRPVWFSSAAGSPRTPASSCLPPALERLPRYASLLAKELQIYALDHTADGSGNVVIVYKITSLYSAALSLRAAMAARRAGSPQNTAQISPDSIPYDEVTDALAEHLWSWMEWLWTKGAPARLPGGRMLQVIDCSGGRLGMVGDKAAQCAMRAFASVAACYPERLQRCILVNPPSWAAAPMRVANALMDERTRSKMALLGAGASDARVRDALSAAMGGLGRVPKEYGGQCGLGLEEYPLHRAWVAHLEGLGMEVGR